ncbi:MAG: hypothetical protein JWM86_2167 [Thermoleophilia bacterium]|nr:hypothetical protein [Thermoleophilia bacterium]
MHLAPITHVTSPASGWIGGVLTFSGRSGTVRTWLRLEDVIGRTAGYDTVRGARIAAERLTRGAAQRAAAIAQDADGRYRVYGAAIDALDGASDVPLHFEASRPKTATGAILDSWIFVPADGLVEVRDGAKLLLPYMGA